jgi:hypothetical protein
MVNGLAVLGWGVGGIEAEAAMVEAGAVELHELADHALLAQHLGDGEHEVGGGGAPPSTRRPSTS